MLSQEKNKANGSVKIKLTPTQIGLSGKLSQKADRGMAKPVFIVHIYRPLLLLLAARVVTA